jgi:transcriptional regulator with XRE-family HTH domain
MSKKDVKPWTTLTQLRKEQGLTQQDMAEAMHVNRISYQRWESGEFEPSIEIVLKLADFFKVSTDFLLDHENGTAMTPEEVEELAQAENAIHKVVKKYTKKN